MVSVGVLGASGYGGGELLRLLADHPELHVEQVWANASAGQTVGALHPHVADLSDLQVEAFDPATVAVDFVFMALPHSQSAQYAAMLSTPVVDLGADFRLADPQKWEHLLRQPARGHLDLRPAGTPRARDRIAASAARGQPGCYATAIALAPAPLVAADVVDGSQIVVVAARHPGAGRSPSVPLLASEVTADVGRTRSGGVHQHTPEIEQALGGTTPGDRASRRCSRPCPAASSRPCTARWPPDTEPSRCWARRWPMPTADENFVRDLPPGQWPAQMTRAGNGAVLQWRPRRHADRVIVVSAIDNLGKGAAGQAIQNANLVLGLDEGNRPDQRTVWRHERHVPARFPGGRRRRPD